MIKEEKAIILDFLPNGYPGMRRPEPIAQAIGQNYFILLELVPREDVTLKLGDTVYIGEDKRDKIRYIRGRLTPDQLTNFASNELETEITKMVESDEKRFVNFFNKAGPITPRLHQLELLPGFGRKHLEDLLNERRAKEFKSFDDIRRRVKLLPDPVHAIVKRIILELGGEEKYHIFVPKMTSGKF